MFGNEINDMLGCAQGESRAVKLTSFREIFSGSVITGNAYLLYSKKFFEYLLVWK